MNEDVNKLMVEKFMKAFDIKYEMELKEPYLILGRVNRCVHFKIYHKEENFLDLYFCFKRLGDGFHFTESNLGNLRRSIFAHLGEGVAETYFMERAKENFDYVV